MPKMKRLLNLALRWLQTRAAVAARRRDVDRDRAHVERLRRRGIRIGEGCKILTDFFSTEPYLVEIGNHVGISAGTQFITHDGSIWLLRESRPDIQHFGKIRIGDNTYIGLNCIILPGTQIGNNCIVGAGSVVRGAIPDNSIVVGNPATVLGRTSLLLKRVNGSPHTFDSLRMAYDDRKDMLVRHFDRAG